MLMMESCIVLYQGMILNQVCIHIANKTLIVYLYHTMLENESPKGMKRKFKGDIIEDNRKHMKLSTSDLKYVCRVIFFSNVLAIAI